MTDISHPQLPQKSHTKLLLGLVGTIVGMFAFAVFLMPPLYDVICDITGLNGKVDNVANPAPVSLQNSTQVVETATTGTAVTATREVKVQLLTHNHPDMPWSFEAETRSMAVIPGQSYQADFIVNNPTSNKMIAQAIPSISPPEGAQYVKKMECFCFNKQPLEAGETKSMPMSFYLAEDFPDHLPTITISYTLYNITDQNAEGDS